MILCMCQNYIVDDIMHVSLLRNGYYYACDNKYQKVMMQYNMSIELGSRMSTFWRINFESLEKLGSISNATRIPPHDRFFDSCQRKQTILCYMLVMGLRRKRNYTLQGVQCHMRNGVSLTLFISRRMQGYTDDQQLCHQCHLITLGSQAHSLIFGHE